MEVPFGERLHDGRRPERPHVPCEKMDWRAEVQRSRDLVAEMSAHIAEIRASAAEMRTTARGAYPLVGRD
jgi:hypothetical protein